MINQPLSPYFEENDEIDFYQLWMILVKCKLIILTALVTNKAS